MNGSSQSDFGILVVAVDRTIVGLVVSYFYCCRFFQWLRFYYALFVMEKKWDVAVLSRFQAN